MLPIIILSVSFLLSSSIILIINPLHIGIVILLLALLLTASIALIISSWLSFLVFLIYIRGILVLFSYFVALTPNQEYKSRVLNITIIFIVTTSIVVITNTHHHTPLVKSYILPSIYLQSSSSILITLALTLLIAIIIIVKLVTVTKGPLRPFNYVQTYSYYPPTH